MKCGWKSCTSMLSATMRPVIYIWARLARDHSPASMELDLPLCSECAEHLTPEDFLSNEGKAQIEAALARLKKDPPLWSTAKLGWTVVQ